MDFLTNEYSFKSASGLCDIYAQSASPADYGSVKGVVQITHGMAEHSNRYGRFAVELCKNGYAVFICDLLGHGNSVSDDSELGYFGENGVEGAHLVSFLGTPDEKRFDIAIDGFFLAIGHKPNSEMFAKWLRTNEQGYIITHENTSMTDVEGVFAAGDVADPRYRQAVTAAASGCRAALDAEKYLNELNEQ